MLLGFPEAEVQQPCLIDSTDSRDRRGLWNSPSWRPGTEWTSWWCSWGGKAVVSFLWGLLLLVWNTEMLKCVKGCMSKRICQGFHVTMCLIILMVCCWTLSQPIKIVLGITSIFNNNSNNSQSICFIFVFHLVWFWGSICTSGHSYHWILPGLYLKYSLLLATVGP